MSVEEAARAARELNRAVAADLERLSPEAWERPSDCEGWSIAAAVVHLTQVAEFLGDSIDRGLGGDGGPPSRVVAEGIQGWRAWRGERQKQALKMPPAALLAEYQAVVGRLEREMDRVEDADPTATGWHPVGSMPLPWIVDQWLFELALHDWDIRVALDPAAAIRPECLGAFGRTLPSRLGRGFGGAEDPAVAGRYRVELDGAQPYGWTIEIGDGRVVSPADDGEADVTIRSDPAAFALVMTNRRPVGDVATRRWRTEGDTGRGERFAAAFRSH